MHYLAIALVMRNFKDTIKSKSALQTTRENQKEKNYKHKSIM